MNPVCRDEISNRPAGTDINQQTDFNQISAWLYGEINLHPGKAGQFFIWYLLKFVYIFF